jgi:hypothetical protein
MDVNLNEVVERPPLPNRDWTFTIVKAVPMEASKENKRTGRKEWYIHCELKPLEPEAQSAQGGGTVFHNWSLSPGALEASDATMSVKKFFELVEFPWGPNGKFNTDDMLNIRFVGTTELETYNGRMNPKLKKVIGKAA